MRNISQIDPSQAQTVKASLVGRSRAAQCKTDSCASPLGKLGRLHTDGSRKPPHSGRAVGGVKLLNSEKKQHFYRSPHVLKVEWQVMRREWMDGIFVGHLERTGASLFLSERGLLRGTRVQRKTADQQWDNEFVRKCRGVPWMPSEKSLR